MITIKRPWMGHLYWKKDHFHPFYDTKADYNTNAKSYYDYLARKNRHLNIMTDFINRLVARNINFNDSNSIDFTKVGDWIDNGGCAPLNFDDEIDVSAVVKISNDTENRTLNNTSTKTFVINNGTSVKNNGVWSPDYIGMINALDEEIGWLQDQIDRIDDELDGIRLDITNIKNDITTIKQDIINIKDENTIQRNALQKIVDNLYNSGAVSNNNLNTFTFKEGRNIATGNINLFGGTSDGSSFIRTNSGSTQNDITAGY